MKASIKIIRWLPRIFCILAILLVSMFALDEFNSTSSVWQQIQGFLIHLIPSYILIFFLFIAWKWELIGGILFMVFGIGLIPLIYSHNYAMNESVLMSLSVVLLINVPFIITGILFIFSHFMQKKNPAVKPNTEVHEK